MLWSKPHIWPNRDIITTLREETAGSLSVELSFGELAKPDVLVYWTAGKEMVGLPENARLLGALLNCTPLPIPPAAVGETGHFVLYSLADHEVVATSQTLMLQHHSN